MSGRQTRRLFIVAFLLSLLVHVVAVLLIRPYALPGDEAPQVVHVMHVRVLRIARLPTPPPPTPPPPKPAATAAPAAAPHRVAPRPISPQGAVHAPPSSSPGPVAAPSPSPHATSTPNCANIDTQVLIAATAPPPDIPPAVRASSQKAGVASVRVVIAPSGAVTQADLSQSSGNAQLDAIAVTMAKSAQYTPATHACKAVASVFAYTVQFSPW